jgi:hypothetical protein
MATLSLFTAAGTLTPYAFRCGYIETDRRTGLVVWWQDCAYHVTGWLGADPGAVYVRKACRTLTEARKAARFPYSPPPA